MPHRLARAVMPVVQHTYLEHQSGMPVVHALWESAMAGALVGMGYSPITALRLTEAMERSLGMREPAGYQRAELGALARGAVHPAMRGIPYGAPGVHPGMAGVSPTLRGLMDAYPFIAGMAGDVAAQRAPAWEATIMDVEVDLD